MCLYENWVRPLWCCHPEEFACIAALPLQEHWQFGTTNSHSLQVLMSFRNISNLIGRLRLFTIPSCAKLLIANLANDPRKGVWGCVVCECVMHSIHGDVCKSVRVSKCVCVCCHGKAWSDDLPGSVGMYWYGLLEFLAHACQARKAELINECSNRVQPNQ